MFVKFKMMKFLLYFLRTLPQFRISDFKRYCSEMFKV